jgi:hypothetical protein
MVSIDELKMAYLLQVEADAAVDDDEKVKILA